MSTEGRSVDEEITRWEAVEAESRQQFEREASAAGHQEKGSSEWADDPPSWWQDPQADEPPPEASVTAPAEAAGSSEGGRAAGVGGVTPEILVADADYTIGTALERAMTDRGWIVRRVVTAELALAEFLRLAPHCLVFDYSMPGMNGLDFLRRLSEFGVPDTTRLVVNSAQTQAIHVRRALASGAHRFLDRPRDSVDELVEVVAEQLVEICVLPPGSERIEAAGPAGSSTEGEQPPEVGNPSSPPLFADTAAVASPPPSPPPPPPPSPGEASPYRSAFGRGGGPPGRIPRLS